MDSSPSPYSSHTALFQANAQGGRWHRRNLKLKTAGAWDKTGK